MDNDHKDGKKCSFCGENSKRDPKILMVVERDNDLINIEKSKIYNGNYHVLGGVLDPIYEGNQARARIKTLYNRLSSTAQNKPEVILALSPTKMGEFTSSYIEKILEPLEIKTTRLGRGLSSGVDMEYIDESTLKQAIDNRK